MQINASLSSGDQLFLTISLVCRSNLILFYDYDISTPIASIEGSVKEWRVLGHYDYHIRNLLKDGGIFCI